MKPMGHIIISGAAAFSIGLIFKSYSIGLISWLAGWTIDCDHLLDYYLYLRRAKTKPNLQEFFSGAFFNKLGKIYVLAHAWEYLFIFLIAASSLLSFPFIAAIGFPYGLHLLLDQFSNRTHPGMYFLLYRIKVNFSVNKLCHL